jgi:hypothetical protein
LTPLLSFVRAFSGDPASVHQRHVLESIPIVYAARCAELAERLAGGEADAGRRGELERFWRRKKSTPAARRIPARLNALMAFASTLTLLPGLAILLCQRLHGC